MGSIPARAGEPGLLGSASTLLGAIPALAGEPSFRVSQLPFRRVYPRACGGTICGAEPMTVTSGLSPRVRGNRQPYRLLIGRLGSIPARAGEPVRAVRSAVT